MEQDMTEHNDWVGDVLGAQPAPAMPAEVQARIEQALTAEAQRRRNGELAAEIKQGYDEVAARSALGSFGANAPSHFDKVGLGLSEQSAKI